MDKKLIERINAQLLPCPFCGGKVEVKSGAAYLDLDITYMVACFDEACILHEIGSNISYEKHILEDLLGRWNTRLGEEVDGG